MRKKQTAVSVMRVNFATKLKARELHDAMFRSDGPCTSQTPHITNESLTMDSETTRNSSNAIASRILKRLGTQELGYPWNQPNTNGPSQPTSENSPKLSRAVNHRNSPATERWRSLRVSPQVERRATQSPKTRKAAKSKGQIEPYMSPSHSRDTGNDAS